MLIAAGPDVDGDVVGDVARRLRRCSIEPRPTTAASPTRAGAGRRAPSDLPGRSATPPPLGLVTFHARAADRAAAPAARRWRGSPPATRRWSSARPATGARWSSPRTSTTAGTISRCTRPSCRSCTRPCAIWRAARGRCRRLSRRRRAGRRAARAGRRDPCRGAAARARPIAVNVDPRESDPARDVGGRFSVGGDAAEGRRNGVGRVGESRASSEDEPAPLAVRAGGDGRPAGRRKRSLGGQDGMTASKSRRSVSMSADQTLRRMARRPRRRRCAGAGPRCACSARQAVARRADRAARPGPSARAAAPDRRSRWSACSPWRSSPPWPR